MKLIAKLVTACMLFTYSMGAWANINGQYSVLLKFNDGYAVQYNKIPGDTQVEALVFRIMNDYPKYNLQKDLVDAQVVQTGQSATPQPIRTQQVSTQVSDQPKKESEWTLGKIVGTVLIVAAIGYGAHLLLQGGGGRAYTGSCLNPSDFARNGSRCGGRAASVRSGGY
jgi:hypothetical protein